MTNQEILAMLDMSRNEQSVWTESPEYGNRKMGESLADLAFRLRDEVSKITNWWDACQVVYEYVSKEKFDKDKGWKSETGIWFQDFAQPIHWIIAALIAKVKDNE